MYISSAVLYEPPRLHPPNTNSLLRVQTRKQEFIDALFQFLKESRLSATLFLSGVDMSNRTDAQMMFVTFHASPVREYSLALIVATFKHADVLHSPAKLSIMG
jgi:hypothetical protein